MRRVRRKLEEPCPVCSAQAGKPCSDNGFNERRDTHLVKTQVG